MISQLIDQSVYQSVSQSVSQLFSQQTIYYLIDHSWKINLSFKVRINASD